jgi:hypothetical protein
MSDISEAKIFTITLTNDSFLIPDGFVEAFFNNTGNGDATWEGTYVMPVAGVGVPSTPITLPAGQSFAYGYVGKGRKGFRIFAPATTVDISLTL